MKSIIIPLRDFLLDPSGPIDPHSEPGDEAIRLIKEPYGSLSSAVAVHLEGDLAVISLEEAKTAKVHDTLKI